MIIKVYVLVLAFLLCIFGLYQFITGKRTILSKKILQKYNLPSSFIKQDGMLSIVIGCILFGIMIFYSMSNNIDVLYIGYIILAIFSGIELFFIIKNQKNLDGIPKKEIGKAFLILLLSIIFVTYFRPVPLYDLFEHAETIQVSVQELGVNNSGTAYIDETARFVLSPQEKEGLITVANPYRYYRNLSSLLKYDGSTKGFPDKILMLYVKENEQIKTICVTSMQEIIIDNHSYTMGNSWEFMDDLQSLLQPALHSVILSFRKL